MTEQEKMQPSGEIVHTVCRLYPPWEGQEERIRINRIQPDGSLRRFYRLQDGGNHSLVAILPSPGESGRREALAAWQIGRHLRKQGAPLPALFGFDSRSGLLLCEDLGRMRLHDLVLQQGENDPAVRSLYKQTVRHLARMQVLGAREFSCSWCWETPRYDQELMMQRESMYFLRALCEDLLGLEVDHDRLLAECHHLAGQAGRASGNFFLYRDFQSRNIMISRDHVAFIDFQAGRLGPLAYDLASLLLDPYVQLSAAMQAELKEVYLRELSTLIKYDLDQFEMEFHLLALQRIMQVLGAYAFLSTRRERMFFRRFIPPALLTMQRLLAASPLADYPALRRLAAEAEQTLLRLFGRQAAHDRNNANRRENDSGRQ